MRSRLTKQRLNDFLRSDRERRMQAAIEARQAAHEARDEAQPRSNARARQRLHATSDEPIRTRSMARLLAKQGNPARALAIYEALLAVDASDASLLAEIEAARQLLAQTPAELHRTELIPASCPAIRPVAELTDAAPGIEVPDVHLVHLADRASSTKSLGLLPPTSARCDVASRCRPARIAACPGCSRSGLRSRPEFPPSVTAPDAFRRKRGRGPIARSERLASYVERRNSELTAKKFAREKA